MTKPACEKVSEQKKCSLDNFAIWVSLCVVIGAVAHLMLDSILSCVEWLWPIYKNPIGLPNINGYFNIIKSNCFPIFIAIELVVSVIAFYMLIYANWKAKNRGYILNSQIMTKMAKFDYFYSPVCAGRLRNSLRSNSPACAGMPRSKNSKFSNFRQHKYAQLCMMNLFMISLVAIAIILPFAMRNNFYMAPDIGNRDFDRDGIKNDKDFDYDNDGIENFYDADANGNGLNNRDEFITQAKEMAGVYSRKGNNFLGRILGIGMISDATMLRVSLENLGIFLSEEMNRDFFKFQEKYKEEVYNYEFSYNAENIYIFFKNKKMLIYDHCDAKQIEEIEKGDVVFYGDNYGHLAIVVDVSSTNYSVIEAGSYYEKVVILTKEEMEKIYGKPQAIVRLF